METETLRFMVQAWECDHLGHVNVRSYMGWLADAAFALVAPLGMGAREAAGNGVSMAAVHAELDFMGELNGGDIVVARSRIEELGERKIVFRHRFQRLEDGHAILAGKLMTVCMDLKTRRAVPWPPAFVAAVRGRMAEAA
jgi:acyl-CoA thioester hydrolase